MGLKIARNSGADVTFSDCCLHKSFSSLLPSSFPCRDKIFSNRLERNGARCEQKNAVEPSVRNPYVKSLRQGECIGESSNETDRLDSSFPQSLAVTRICICIQVSHMESIFSRYTGTSNPPLEASVYVHFFLDIRQGICSVQHR